MVIRKEAGIKESSQVSSLGSWMRNGTIPSKVGSAGEEPGSMCVRVVKMNSVWGGLRFRCL